MAVAKAPKKLAAFAELNELARAGKVHEDEERAKTGSSNLFIKLIGDSQANELIEGKPEFIKGAKLKHFVISSHKITLGPNPEVTVLGMFKIFEETEPKKEDGKEMPRIFGYWMPNDATQIEVEGTFERPFKAKDGTIHILRPVHWVFIRLHNSKHDIEGAVFAFRSIGNSVYKELEKVIKAQSAVTPQLRFKVTNQPIEAKSFNKTYLYPKFEVVGRNFEYENDEIVSMNDEIITLDELKTIMGYYKTYQEDYAEGRMVSYKPDIRALIGGPSAPAQKALGAPKEGKAYTKAPKAAAEVVEEDVEF